MQLKKQQGGFTLIELMVVIAIMGIMFMLSYAPYNYYQNKARVKLASREIAQSFYEGKNMAVSGIKGKIQNSNADDGSSFENKSVGIVIATLESENTRLEFQAYPANIGDSLSLSTSVIKTKVLQQGVVIDSIVIGNKSYEKVLVLYEAITGKVRIFDASNIEILDLSSGLTVDFSFQGSENTTLQKSVTLLPSTNIVDYK